MLTIWLRPKLARRKTIAFIRFIYHGGKLNLLLPARARLINILPAAVLGAAAATAAASFTRGVNAALEETGS